MLTANGQVAGALISGIDPVYEKQVSIVNRHLGAGQTLDSLTADDFGIVLVNFFRLPVVGIRVPGILAYSTQ